MGDYTIHLTDEQERTVRRYFFDIASDADIDSMIEVRFDIARQIRDAIALIDTAVAEAAEKSDQ